MILNLVRLTCRANDENHMRSLLLQAVSGQPLLLRSLESEEMENRSTVRVRATLMSTGHLDNLLEQIVSRLGLEPGVTAECSEMVAAHE